MNVTGLKKQFFRVKQNLDQNLGRAERTEVLNDEELEIERRVELMRTICQTVVKKVTTCIHSVGAGNDIEKRLKKVPESGLSHSLIESSVQLGSSSASGQLFQLCGDAQGKLANERLHLEIDVENRVIKVLQDMLEVDIPSLQKLKKQLNSKILDMDSAKARYTSLVKQSQTGGNQVAGLQAKIDSAKDEMEDAIMKCEQFKDQLATEMYTFVGKESDLDHLLFDLIQAQVSYHKRSLQVLDSILPALKECIDYSVRKPAFGLSLKEHLSSTGCEISAVIEECVSVLYDCGLEEEGLFRIAGSASKIKKLKAAFNSNTSSGSVLASMDDLDPHVIASVLKLYLRELPEPLMTFALYSDLMNAVHKQGDQRMSALHSVLERLPKANYLNLRYLIKFLATLSENAAVNKMSPSNIAVVMGPNLMWAEGEQGPNMLTTGMQSTIVETLVANAEYFFPGDVNFTAVSSRGGGIASHPTFTNLHTETNSHANPAVNQVGYHGYSGNGGMASEMGARSQAKSQSAESLPSAGDHRASTAPAEGHESASGPSGGSPSTLKRKKPPAPQPPAEKPAYLSEKPGGSRGTESIAAGLASTVNPLVGISSNGGPETIRAHSAGYQGVDRGSGDFNESSGRPDRPPSPKVVERPKAPPPERPLAPGSHPNPRQDESNSKASSLPRIYPTLSEEMDGTGTPGKQQGDMGPPVGRGEKSHSRQLSAGGAPGSKPPRPGPPPPPRPRGESKGSEDEASVGGRGHSRGSSKGSAHDVSYL